MLIKSAKHLSYILILLQQLICILVDAHFDKRILHVHPEILV